MPDLGKTMRQTSVMLLLLPALFVTGPITLFGQFRYVVAIPDFDYDGELWQEELGGAVADALINRLRIDGNFLIQNREQVNKILREYGVERAYDADLHDAAPAYRRMNVALAIVGRITKFEQIQEIEGLVTVQLVLDVQFIDTYSPYIISSERFESDTRLEKKLTSDTPLDKETTDKLLRPAMNRIRYRVQSVLRNYLMR